MLPEKIFASKEKVAIFHIFFSEKNFAGTFFTQKNGKKHFWGLI
jgi:hypothetical protein